MNNSFNGHLCIVFALEHYNPLNMIRAFGENGINPVYISVKRRYEVATRSKYISKLHRVDSVEEGFELLMKEYGKISLEEYSKRFKSPLMQKLMCDYLIREGYGERSVLLSNDTNESGYHGMYYGFGPEDESYTLITLN